MYDVRTQYAIDNFFEENYFLEMSSSYILKECSEEGKTELHVNVTGDNLCLEDFDKKHKCIFLREDKKFGMRKCSDHLIFQKQSAGWRLIIIEMKTSVGAKRWLEIKQKTRTSYLTAKAIAVFLGIELTKVQVITTYENERFYSLEGETSPAIHKPFLGEPVEDSKKDEWDKNLIKINIGEEIEFPHNALKMNKSSTTSQLEGSITL